MFLLPLELVVMKIKCLQSKSHLEAHIEINIVIEQLTLRQQTTNEQKKTAA